MGETGRPARPAPLPTTIIDAASAFDPALPDCGFQQVIDKAAAAGGMVRPPEGWYSITGRLTIQSHVTLCGEGVATVLVWEGSGAAITSEGTTDVAVRRLIVRPAKSNQNSSSGIQFKNVRGGLIESVIVEVFHGAGIAMSQVNEILIAKRGPRV